MSSRIKLNQLRLKAESGDWIYYGKETINIINHKISDKSIINYIRYQEVSNNNIDVFPPYSTKCECGHVISENCYIKNIKTNEILVVGNCCILKFYKSVVDDITKFHKESKKIKRKTLKLIPKKYQEFKDNRKCAIDKLRLNKKIKKQKFLIMKNQKNIIEQEQKENEIIRARVERYMMYEEDNDIYLDGLSIVKFGRYKYNYKSYSYIYGFDVSYCDWILTLKDCVNKVLHFQKYIMNRRRIDYLCYRR